MSEEDAAEHLNELRGSIQDAELDELSLLLHERMPTSDDACNRFRIVTQELFVRAMRGATPAEKSLFVSALVSEVFQDEERMSEEARQVVQELPLPLGLNGAREILRVFFEGAVSATGGMVVIVDAGAQPPEAWGLTLHDVASHIADHAVEKALVKPSGRAAFLDRIARFFVKEHKRPTEVTERFKPKLDA